MAAAGDSGPDPTGKRSGAVPAGRRDGEKSAARRRFAPAGRRNGRKRMIRKAIPSRNLMDTQFTRAETFSLRNINDTVSGTAFTHANPESIGGRGPDAAGAERPHDGRDGIEESGVAGGVRGFSASRPIQSALLARQTGKPGQGLFDWRFLRMRGSDRLEADPEILLLVPGINTFWKTFRTRTLGP